MTDKSSIGTMATSDLLRLVDERRRQRSPGLHSPKEYSDEVVALFELECRGMICAQDAVIAWHDDRRGRTKLVAVADSRHLPGLRGADNLRGADVDGDWLKAPAATPEAVFLHMAEVGFVDRAELASALAGFAKIIECGWARELHAAAQKLDAPEGELEAA